VQGRAGRLQAFHQLEEIPGPAREAIEPSDDDRPDLAGLGATEEGLEAGAVEILAARPGVATDLREGKPVERGVGADGLLLGFQADAFACLLGRADPDTAECGESINGTTGECRARLDRQGRAQLLRLCLERVTVEALTLHGRIPQGASARELSPSS
jgi:hypothetical protein